MTTTANQPLRAAVRREVDAPPPAAQDCISAAVEFVATQPGGAERILRTHRRGPHDYCTGCVHTPIHWPCSAAGIAMRVTEHRPRRAPRQAGDTSAAPDGWTTVPPQ